MTSDRNKNLSIAVIVTTYNRPDALRVVLEGYLAQQDQNFELLVADDGSKPDTAELVKEYQQRAAFKISHIWHEDDGFRAAAIRNRALAATQADYVIFTDGDCVPRSDFIGMQRLLAEQGWFYRATDYCCRKLLLKMLFVSRFQFTFGKITIGKWFASKVA